MIQKNWQELIKPNKLDITAGGDPKRQATVIAEPLERGFGQTLGNAIRRVLLDVANGRPPADLPPLEPRSLTDGGIVVLVGAVARFGRR